MSDRLLVRGGRVVSMDETIGDRPDCDVLIEDGTIVSVEPGLAVADAVVIDAAGTVVIPGFVDTHRHTWTTVLRAAQPDSTPPDHRPGARAGPSAHPGRGRGQLRAG
jgi:cytosine/adenosine deaminase-related metal-dependent hydrolase